MTTENPSALFDFADQLALISSEVLRFRIKNKATLSTGEKSQLEDIEIELDKVTNKVRAQGIASLGTITAPQRLEVETATKDAEALLRRIKKIERALDIATSVLNLAIAAMAGQPQGILTALNTVKDAVAGDTA
jgi:t-SNARE complex subunit (syntaxin)